MVSFKAAAIPSKITVNLKKYTAMPKKPLIFYAERDKAIVRFFFKGMRTWALAEKFGLSEGRIREIIKPYRPWRKHPRSSYMGYVHPPG